MGKKCRFYPINNMCRSLGEPKSRALLMFHAYSGCDTTSAFSAKGKKSTWGAWQAYDDATVIFVSLAKHPFQQLDVDCQQFQKLERLTVIVYDKSSPLCSINQVRKELFCHGNRAMERLPPTQDALLQHIDLFPVYLFDYSHLVRTWSWAVQTRPHVWTCRPCGRVCTGSRQVRTRCD